MHALYFVAYENTTVRGLRNNYAQVIKWVAKGEEVEVTRRGKVVAKVVPSVPARVMTVDWAQSAALNRPAWVKVLTAKESAAVLAGSQGG